MFEESFSQGDSLLHRMDCRARLGAALALCAVIAASRSLAAPCVGLGIGFLLVLAARLRLKEVFWRLVAVNGFIAFLWLVVPLTYGGDAMAKLGPLEISRQGVHVAALVTLKSNAIVLAFLALVATMDAPRLGRALSGFGVPQRMVQILLFTSRYVHVIGQEFRRLTTAAKIRGFVPRTSLHTYRTYAYLAAMVLVRSFDRAERVHQAMRLRGFAGRFPTLYENRFQFRDALLALPVILASAGLACLEWMR